MHHHSKGIAVLAILLVLGFASAMAQYQLPPIQPEPVPTAEIEKLAPATLFEVAATCAALTGVIYNADTKVTIFAPSPFWEKFTSTDEIESIQFEIASVLKIDPTAMDLFLKGSHLCVELRMSTFEKNFGFDPEEASQ
jgi:hypothetical protein